MKQTFIFLISPSAGFPYLVCPVLTAVQKQKFKVCVLLFILLALVPVFFLLEGSLSFLLLKKVELNVTLFLIYAIISART